MLERQLHACRSYVTVPIDVSIGMSCFDQRYSVPR
jgi:hypothetical protein